MILEKEGILRSERKSNESAKLKKISTLEIFGGNKFDKFLNDDFCVKPQFLKKRRGEMEMSKPWLFE
jgi:hypothetical protein